MKHRTNAEARCPACHHHLSGASPLPGNDPAPPKPGDLSVCIGCALVLEFNTDLTVRVFRELDTLDPETRNSIESAQWAIARMARNRGV